MHRTQTLRTPPPAFRPHQPDGPAEHGKVTVLHDHPLMRERPNPAARAPTRRPVVSTWITASAADSCTPTTRKPGSPSMASARPIASLIVRGLLSPSQGLDSSNDDRGP